MTRQVLQVIWALALAGANLAMGAPRAPVQVIYVSPLGKDEAVGTKVAPLATLGAALVRSRTVSRQGHGAIIHLLPGTHRLSSTIELGVEDSGSPEMPLIIEGDSFRTVRLTGARVVTGMRPLVASDSPPRLPAAALGRVWAAPLLAVMWPDLPGIVPTGFGRPLLAHGVELQFKGKVMPLAAWPDAGYVKVAQGTVGESVPGFSVAARDRLLAWKQEPDLWVHGYWNQDWQDSYERVQTVDAISGRVLLVEPGPQGPVKLGQRVRVLNALSELDQPGEWYLDRVTRTLYFWPPTPPGAGDIELSQLSVLLSGQGVKNLIVRGITLDGARSTAMHFSGVEGVTVSSCRFQNLGGGAVDLAGRDSLVEGCEIQDAGEGGIYLTGGDRRTLIRGNLIARNNRISRVNRWGRCYRPAVQLNGVGNTAEGNLIEDLSHTAILFYGNDHRIACNRILGVCREAGDAGAIYSGRDWAARGTVIENNLVADSEGGLPQPVAGVYLDDQLSGITVRNNLFRRVPIGILVGGGRDNLIEGNWFDHCPTSLFVDGRGLTWQKTWVTDPGSPLHQSLQAVPYASQAYGKYPGLLQVLADWPGAPLGNLVHRNRAVGPFVMNIFPEATAWVFREDNLGEKAVVPAGFPSNCDVLLRPGVR